VLGTSRFTALIDMTVILSVVNSFNCMDVLTVEALVRRLALLAIFQDNVNECFINSFVL
jgi:hypothetical protein